MLSAVLQPADAPPVGWRQSRLFAPWVLFSVACVGAMWAMPGHEVVPFHLIWVTFALAYGFEVWPRRLSLGTVATFAVLSGAVLLWRAHVGVIEWAETTEIVLMVILSALVIWHVHRRQDAMSAIVRLARESVDAAESRARLARLTSHEMRTPLTIAIGYTDLMLAQVEDAAIHADLEVVRDELDRLMRAGDRMVRMVQMHDSLDRTELDVDEVLQETAQRWAAVTSRRWTVEATAGRGVLSAERLRACLDTLVENAVRYTGPQGTVRLFSLRVGADLWVGVADDGPGLPLAVIAEVNDIRLMPEDAPAVDPAAQTGFGLGIVREVIGGYGGRLRAGRSREGGALLVMLLPGAARDTLSAARRLRPALG